MTLIVAVHAALAVHASSQELGWDYQPYKVRAMVALDVPGGIAGRMASELPSYLRRRVDAAMGRVWSFQVEVADGPARHQILSQIAAPSPSLPGEISLADDEKLVLIAIRWSPAGYELAAREFDAYVERWGTAVRRTARQRSALLEQTFALLHRAVAPLAQVELDTEDENKVVLKPRGAALTQPASGESWTTPGEVFLPILRRTARDGEVVEGGIQPVPWTYLEVTDAGGDTTQGRIHSGTRRPFGVRRRGRLEQLAIALRGDAGSTKLRLHSRSAEDKPLVGYEVFAQKADGEEESVERLGATNRRGELVVPPAKEPVRVLFLKNGGQLLARLPIVPGAEPQLEVPLPDDDARLAAEAQLAALREELIDVVARRNILMARVRQSIKEKDFAAAQKLLSQINELPGRSQFNIEIQSAQRRFRSEDPQIQRRIDQMFEGTQVALTRYLDVRPINELTDDLRTAQQGGS